MNPKTARRTKCGWCTVGKPLDVGPFKNPGCITCEKKPDAIDGVKLLSTPELNVIRKAKKRKPPEVFRKTVLANKKRLQEDRENYVPRRYE